MRKQHLTLACAALIALATAAQPGTLDPSFNSGTAADGSVNASLALPNGKIILAGDFTDYNGSARNRIVRLNADGSLDATFNPGIGFDGAVAALAMQPDGKILAGGDFTTFDGTAASRVVRLNSNGSRDGTFTAGGGPNGPVYALAVQSDGAIIIGGDFTDFNGAARQGVARVDDAGNFDAAFNPATGASSIIETVWVQYDGNILIGGDIPDNGNLMRLLPNGNIDPAFHIGTGASYTVYAVAQQFLDDKIIVAGHFDLINGMEANRIARLLPNGTLDPTFDSGDGTDNPVYAMAMQSDGKILIGGQFTEYDGDFRKHIARLLPNGNLDQSFDLGPTVGPNNTILTLVQQAGGKIIVGGDITTWDGAPCGGVARLRIHYAVDDAFNSGAGANGAVLTSKTVGANGDKIIIGGEFTHYNGVQVNHIARILRDGSLDMDFLANTGSGANGPVKTIDTLPSGEILIGGDFSAFDGNEIGSIAKLSCEGEVDPDFTSNLESVDDIFVIDEEFINIIGTTAEVNIPYPYTGISVVLPHIQVSTAPPEPPVVQGQSIIVFSSTITISGNLTLPIVSTVVQPTPTAPSYPALVVKGPEDFEPYPSPGVGSGASGTNDGSGQGRMGQMSPLAGLFNIDILHRSEEPEEEKAALVVTGNFSHFNDEPRGGIAVLKADGSLDTTFDPGTGADGAVLSVAELPGGKLMIGGEFTSFNGVPVNRIARLNRDGSLDLTFNAGDGADEAVRTISMYGADPVPGDECANYHPGASEVVDVFVGGEFTQVDGTGQGSVAVFGEDQDPDCLGVPGGSALPGATCDDGDPNTGNDVYGTDCVCAGQVIDCLGVPGGTALPGTACDDGNANTENDVYGADCVCAGTAPQDFTVACFVDCSYDVGICDEVPVASLTVSAINGFAETIDVSISGAPAWMSINPNDNQMTSAEYELYHVVAVLAPEAVAGSYTYDIVLTSTPSGTTHSLTVSTTFHPGGDATCGGPYGPFTTADDPITLNGSPAPGTWVGDGVDGNTFDPALAGPGNHLVEYVSYTQYLCSSLCSTWITVTDPPAQDCLGIPGGTALPGTACDDGDASTENDIWDANCECHGTPIGGPCTGNQVVINITGANAGDVTWKFVDGSSNEITTGSGAGSSTVCLGSSMGAAWYGFKLEDSNGNGLGAGGGWELRTLDGKLILRDNFDMPFISSPVVPGNSASYGAYHSFALPLGAVNIQPDECGIMNNRADNKVYAVKQTGNNYQNSTLNYQFEFSNPDSGRFRRIAKPRNYVIFSEMASLKPLVAGVTYFARVRTDKEGVMTDARWGAGCEMALGSNVACTGLIDDPGHQYYSCNVTRRFRHSSFLVAKPVYGATQYEFRVYQPGEGYDHSFVRNTYTLELNWTAAEAPALEDLSSYMVQVRAKVNNVWGDFNCGGAGCPVYINNTPTIPQGSLVQVAGEATLWPNPSRDGQVSLNIDGIAGDVQHITVDVKDIYGQHVYGQEFANSGERFNTVLDLPGDIATGVYMVSITVNGEVMTKRLSIVR